MNHKEKLKIARRMYKPVYKTDEKGKLVFDKSGKKIRVKNLGLFNNPIWNERAEKIKTRVRNREIVAMAVAAGKRRERSQKV